MASIFKRKRKVKLAGGKTVTRQSGKYYTRLTDADGIKRTIPLFTDKTASEQRAAQLQKEFELAKAGVVDRYKEHRRRSLKEHLEDFERSLLARGDTKKHAQQTAQRVRTVIEGCKFVTWSDIQPSKVQSYVASLRDSENGTSAATSNSYLKCTRQFCRWMVQDGRAAESPLEHLRGETVRKIVDEEHPRRALEIDELRHLLRVTKVGPKRFGMAGHERYLLYRFTAETGLRAKELRSLKISSFDLDNLTVGVSGAQTKNKREAVQQIRPDTAAELKEFFSGKLPTVKAFGGTYRRLTDKTAEMLKADLADANIPYVVDGLYFDFHALRHETGTLLAAGGVHPKVAQSIMRHGDINLTMSRYTHTLTGQEAKAVEAMPDLSVPSTKREIATGTDGREVNAPDDGTESLTPRWTPKLTPTAFSESNQSAAVGNLPTGQTENAPIHNPLPGSTLDTKRKALSAIDTDKAPTRPKGLETSTIGQQERLPSLWFMTHQVR
ncbi:MAG: tyrosine-type recombinase/integrase [Planctomycetota bacterium]|jgi:integrase